MYATYAQLRFWAPALGAAVALCVAVPAEAQEARARAQAEILDPLTVTRIEDLDFGAIIPSATPGRVVINRESGACRAEAGVTLAGGDCHRAQFVASGSASRLVTISIDPGPVTLSRSGGGETMVMDQLLIGANPAGTIGPAGELTFYAVGQLEVGANQPPGTYEATFTVSVEYQ
jgi:hypothetical protein